MFRSICLSCSAIALLVIAAGAAFQQQCSLDTYVCSNPTEGECFEPDQRFPILCSSLPETTHCSGRPSGQSNQALCTSTPWRSKPKNYHKCYRSATNGKLAHVSKFCYDEVVCVWNSATHTCQSDFNQWLFCYVSEWQVDNTPLLCDSKGAPE